MIGLSSRFSEQNVGPVYGDLCGVVALSVPTGFIEVCDGQCIAGVSELH